MIGVSGSRACVWRAANGELLYAIPAQDSVYNWICLASDGRTAALGGPDYTMVIVDIVRGQVLHRLAGHHTPIWRLVFSPDGRWLASGSMDRTVCLWDAETGALLQTMRGHTNIVQHVSFCPDGRLLASASHDETIKLWAIASEGTPLGPEPCLATLRAPGPYAGMNITGATGITDGQKATLIALGAVVDGGSGQP